VPWGFSPEVYYTDWESVIIGKYCPFINGMA